VSHRWISLYSGKLRKAPPETLICTKGENWLQEIVLSVLVSIDYREYICTLRSRLVGDIEGKNARKIYQLSYPSSAELDKPESKQQ